MASGRGSLEREIESRAVGFILRRGFRAEKWGFRGWPDRQILLGGGFHFWYEFKRQEGKLRKAQEIIKEKLELMGDRVYVPRSYHEAIEQLEHEVRLRSGGSPVDGNRRW